MAVTMDEKGMIKIPEEFIARMEGKLKSGSRTISPAEIKGIWKM